MALLAFAVLAILLPQQARGPVSDDDGTGIAARPLTRQRCSVPTDPNEIVVCKRDEPDRYRIGPRLPPTYQRRALNPAVRLPGGGEARVEAQQHNTGFFSVPAAMVSVRIPLGRKKKKPDDPQK